jgi:hypothetical protein
MIANQAEQSLCYCGRTFTAQELDWIRQLIRSEPKHSRLQLSRLVCEKLAWVRQDGRLKDMSCRVAMLRMHTDGLIQLPEPRNKNGNGRTRPKITSASDPRQPISLPAGALGQLTFRLIEDKKDSFLWNELIERYHYLGHKPLPGAQLRYLVFSSSDCVDELGRPHLLAALGFGAAAWKVDPRDQFIGWTHDQRKRLLHLVANNARFLILPWITSHNLASRILAGVAKCLPAHWELRYDYRPVLLETFVQKNRFTGSSYRAANWLHVGQTQGRGKLDAKHRNPLPVKDIFLYPLHRRFRYKLTAS